MQRDEFEQTASEGLGGGGPSSKNLASPADVRHAFLFLGRAGTRDEGLRTSAGEASKNLHSPKLALTSYNINGNKHKFRLFRFLKSFLFSYAFR